MSESTEARLSVDVGSDPIRGTLIGPDGAQRRFRGWLQLSQLVDDVAHSAEVLDEPPPG